MRQTGSNISTNRPALDITSGGTQSVVINYDGSASFGNNSIFLSGVTGNATFTGSVYASGTFYKNWSGSGLNGTPLLAADDAVLWTEPDNPANYVTTMVDGEETRVYNGPTLDVKDRLQNLLARVDAMEANELIDDATDSSLLNLVSNLDTRLTNIETRLAALEGVS